MLNKHIMFLFGLLFTVIALADPTEGNEPVIYLTPVNDQATPQLNHPQNPSTLESDDSESTIKPSIIHPAAPAKKHHFKHFANKNIYGPTTENEHIWSLAAKLRPTTAVTVQQMIIALQKANPNAFDENNINGLKSGQKLKIPTLAEIQAISAVNADTFVKEQNEKWQKKSKNNSFVKPLIANNKNNLPIIPEAPPITLKAPVQNNSIQNNNDQIKKIQEQIVTAQSQLKNYEELTDHKINELVQQNLTAEKQLSNLTGVTGTLKIQLSTLLKDFNLKINKQTDKIITSDHGNVVTLPKNKVAWWIIWGAAFLIVLLWMPTSKKSKPSKPTQERQEPIVSSADHDLKNEYDFMNSQEGMPAKLDLARAYIDMDDNISAEKVLREVIAKGDKKERKQAQQMLKSIENAKVF